MAKETVKNENIDVETNEVAGAAESAPVGNTPRPSVDPFAFRRERDLNGEETEREGDTVIFKDTGTYLSRYTPPNSEYTYFSVGFEQEAFNGDTVQLAVNFEPVIYGREAYKLLNSMFGKEDYLPAEIVKTTTDNGNGKRTSYGLQVTKVNENGVPITVVMRTRITSNSQSNRSERACFNAYIEMLKADGKIT